MSAKKLAAAVTQSSSPRHQTSTLRTCICAFAHILSVALPLADLVHEEPETASELLSDADKWQLSANAFNEKVYWDIPRRN